MSCTICGRKTGPGALLCRPCKSALKRARQFSVLELPGMPPAVTIAGLAMAPSRPVAVMRRKRKALPARAPAVKRMVAIVLGGLLALGALAYLGQLLSGHAEAQAEPARALWAVLPLPVKRPPQPELAVDPERSSTIVPAPSAVRPKQAAPKAVMIPTPPLALPMAAEAKPEAPAASVAVAAAEAPRPAPALVQAAPPVDRWQAMADALATCAREGALAGFICHERVRLSSCEGYWGRVAQCPLPPEKTR